MSCVEGGVALVIENEGPRTAFRYSTWPRSSDALFEALSPEAFAKLFCIKRALRGNVFELQIDDDVFVSCSTTATFLGHQKDELAFWGDDDVDESSKQGESRTLVFSVVWCAGKETVAGLGGADALRAMASDMAAALAHEERRNGYVSREAKILVSAENREAATRTSRLARELRTACDMALSKTRRNRTIRINDWIDVSLDDLLDPPLLSSGLTKDDDWPRQRETTDESDLEDDKVSSEKSEDDDDDESDQKKSHDKRRTREDREEDSGEKDLSNANFRPYEALMLRNDDEDLPLSTMPQLRALVKKADPRKSFQTLAEELCLPLERVYDLAGHLVKWNRATVAGAARPESVYAPRPQAHQHLDDLLESVLASFGTASSLRDATAKLKIATRLSDDEATSAIFRALRAGRLAELNTYAIRIDGSPSADLLDRTGFDSSTRLVATSLTNNNSTIEDKKKQYKRHSSNQIYSPPMDDFAIGLDLSHSSPPLASSDHTFPPSRWFPDTQRPIRVFRKLSPYFDGRHSLVDMSYRENISIPEIETVLRTFKNLVVTLQR